jgi:hypothetical protein
MIESLWTQADKAVTQADRIVANFNKRASVPLAGSNQD